MINKIKEMLNILKINNQLLYKFIMISFNVIISILAIVGVLYLLHIDATSKNPYQLFIEPVAQRFY